MALHTVGCTNFQKREYMIEKDLDSKGTLTIKVDITIGTPKREIWFPKLSTMENKLLSSLYHSIEPPLLPLPAKLQPMHPSKYRSRMTRPLLPHSRLSVPLTLAPRTQLITILIPS